jgi:hypothetical protein
MEGERWGKQDQNKRNQSQREPHALHYPEDDHPVVPPEQLQLLHRLSCVVIAWASYRPLATATDSIWVSPGAIQ